MAESEISNPSMQQHSSVEANSISTGALPSQLATLTDLPSKSIHIFCSYSHEDRTLMEGLKKHLWPLERQGLIVLWNDREINPGDRWKDEISQHIDNAQIILLMISPDFLKSEYCYGEELARAMERHKQEEARVIPIILRPALWHDTPFNELQALPTDAKPVMSSHWHNPDEAFVDIAKGILKTIRRMESGVEQSHHIHHRGLPTSPLQLRPTRSQQYAIAALMLCTAIALIGISLSVPWYSPVPLLSLTFVSLLIAVFVAGKWLWAEHLHPKDLWRQGLAGKVIYLIIAINLVMVIFGGSIAVPMLVFSHPPVSPTPTKPAPLPPTIGKLLYFREIFSGYWLNDVKWSPDGQYIATANGDNSVWVLDAKNGSDVHVYQNDACHSHTCWFNAVAWSPDSEHIAAATGDGTVQVWDIVNGEHFAYRSHSGAVWAIAWSPDGTRIASAGHDGAVEIWDATTGHLIYTYHGHTQGVWAVAWSPDGNRIASGGVDKTVQVWNVNDGKLIYTYHGHLNKVFSIAWSPDGSRIASASGDATVQVWNVTNGNSVLTYRNHTSSVQSVAWSPDGKKIVSASNDATVQIWDATSGTPIYTYRGHHNGVFGVAWSPDGNYIASAGDDGTVQVWWAL